MIPKTIKEVHLQVSEALRRAGIVEARQESRILIAKSCDLLPSDILSQPDTPIGMEQSKILESLTQRRLSREPLSHILGERGFWTLVFNVNSNVLDPRADSETIIESILRHRTSPDVPRRILDLGTGSGCLLLSLLSEWRYAIGVGVDLSEMALEVARSNAQRNGLDHRVEFIQSDWGQSILGEALFDIIVSNPPYIPESHRENLQPEVRLYEPALALFAGIDGLDAYQKLLPDVVRLLKPKGFLALEIGIDQAQSVCGLVAQVGLTVVEVSNDLGGIPRCVLARKE